MAKASDNWTAFDLAIVERMLEGDHAADLFRAFATSSRLEGEETLSIRSWHRVVLGEQRPHIKQLVDELHVDVKVSFAPKLLAAKVDAIATLRGLLKYGSERGKVDAARSLATDFGTIEPEEHQAQGITMADAVLLLHERDANAAQRGNGAGRREGAGNGGG